MTTKCTKLEFTEDKIQEYGKFTIIIARDANFTNCPAVHPFTVESVVEWYCPIELLEEFYQDSYAYQLNNMSHNDEDLFPYPSTFDGNVWVRSNTIEDWIDRGDTKEFANQFVEKYIDVVLLETQYDFKAEMKIVERSNKKVAA